MTVYVECVIIDNFSVTMLAALLSYRFLSVTVSKIRCVIASAVGTAVAVLYPLINVHAVLLALIKIALGAVLSLILFWKKCNVLKGAGAFVLITFFFGGVLFAVGLMVYADANKALTLPLSDFPIGVVILGAIGTYFVCKRVVMRVKRMRDSRSFVTDTEITVFSKTFRSKGFLDTGNRLYDEKTGLPVVVLNLNAALQLLDSDKLSAILNKRGEEISNGAHYIEYSTVGGKSNKILVLKPQELRLYFGQTEHRIKDVMIGISFSKFGDSTDYDIILHPAIV